MKYDVTLHGSVGFEVVTVEAEGGDDAAAKAWKRGTIVKGVEPSADQTPAPKRGRPAAEG